MNDFLHYRMLELSEVSGALCKSVAVLLVVLAIAGLASCASLLPSGEVEVTTHFASFDQARQSIESLKPFLSTKQTVADLGLDPYKQSNIVILTYSDILRHFVAGSIIERKDLDKGIMACLEAHERCVGWDINISKITRQRTGNFLLDLINYRRSTETTGWRFNATILLVNDTVVYRAWGGQPQVIIKELTNNPLGPFQNVDLGSIVR